MRFQEIGVFGIVVCLALQAFGAELSYKAPKDWLREKPTSSLRKDQFRLPGPKGSEDATLAIFHFPGTGGDVEANLQRWYFQFRDENGDPISQPENKEQLKVNKIPLTYVYLGGTYLESKSPMMMGGPKVEKRNYAMMGAIAETKDGAWFFKTVGPKKSVDRWKAEFRAFLETISEKK